jgi:hypothetical protein
MGSASSQRRLAGRIAQTQLNTSQRTRDSSKEIACNAALGVPSPHTLESLGKEDNPMSNDLVYWEAKIIFASASIIFGFVIGTCNKDQLQINVLEQKYGMEIIAIQWTSY